MLGKHVKTLNYNFARSVVNLTGQKINQTKASLHSSSSLQGCGVLVGRIQTQETEHLTSAHVSAC